ncbi:hypothetical protein [Streptomyces roseoverticillatus]|uniref:hypothetical protein n=1 Tax=Streptomyces roseoverticillatus TaxID=66429 RepID=UPI0004C16DFE|nr:hypothetical protein [Streptomyces roseoverticillatus]
MTTTAARPPRIFCELAPHPDDGDGSDSATYTVTFTNHDAEPFRCDQVTLTLARDGKDDGECTPFGTDGVAFQGEEDSGTDTWSITAEDEQARFTATPGPSRRVIPAGGKVDFTLALPRITEAVVQAVTTVAGAVDGQSATTARESHLIGPGTVGSLIQNLKATPFNAERGKSVKLTWNDKPKEPSPDYTLTWTAGGKARRTKPAQKSTPRYYRDPDSGLCTYETDQLTERTVFVLTAEKNSRTDTKAVFVLVAEGDLQVGKLTVNGTTRIFGSPQKLVPEAKRSTDPGQETPLESAPAPTSGLLLATLRTEGPSGASGKAKLTVIAPSSATDHTITLPARREGHLTAVVRDGDRVRITVSVENTGPTAKLDATWFPFGCLSAPDKGRLSVK